ncbi:MAG: SprB repeat-containing protein, partial [Bacteroidia bacterium]|nr:SprB repeat-containing protein [Bacteroidia bacterium]
MKHSVFLWRKLYWVWTFVFMLLFSHVLRAGVDGGGKVVERHAESRSLLINLTFSLSDYNGFNISCNGLSDGSIDLTPNGGSAPYSYVWSTGALSEDLSGLPAGTYTVTVTDFLGDTQTGSVTLTEPAVIGIVQDSIRADSCGAAADGAVFISVTGGVSPYGYIWSNFALTEDVSGLIAGNYTVLVTDANNCVNQGVFTVTEVPAMILSTTNTNVSCSGGSNGAIDLSVQGGTFPFTYQWSNGGSSQDLSGIPAGTYTLTITDADVCKITTQFSITEPSAINLSATAADVACNGAATGSIDLTAGGGTPGYTFSWSNGSSVEDPAGLLAGTYTVTVTDANLCTALTSAVINQPAAINLSSTVNNVLCNGGTGGSIDLTVNGGTPGFTYSWSNGSSSQDPSGLSAGTYTVTVTDANLCTAGTSIVVGQPAALSLSTLVTNVSCNSAATGSINLTVAGGTPGYSYAWNNGSISEDPSGLIAGTYTVTVTDANLCTASTSAIVTHPTALSLSTAQVNVACNGASTGSIDLSVSGATPGYTYAWSNGSSNQDVFNLFAGTYTVTVTDANLCTAVTSVNITQPTAFILTASVTNVACNGGSNGSINLTVGGGTPGYTFSWSNGSSSEDPAGLVTGTYTVTVTDANSCTSSNIFVVGQASALSLSTAVTNVSCNGAATGSINLAVGGGTPGYTYAWSNGSNSEDPAGLIAGTYTVTVTDANGCTASTVASISQPSAFSLSTSVTALTCNGSANGSINLTVGGGTPGYSFSWSNGSSSEDISGLLSGTYTVTVTDANLCTASTSALVTQPSGINLSTTVTNATCNGSATGGINLSVSGGTPGYTYSWSNGNSSEDISGVQSGTYTVTVTDANLCTASISAAISQNQAITISFVPVSGTCNASNGSVTVLPGGGVPGYTFLWSTGSTSQVLTGLAAATYTVTVTDAASCTASSSVNILNTGSPAATLTAGVNVSCNGGSNGSLDISVSGGTPAYSYLWSNGALTQDVSGLVAGTYTVT